MPSSIWRDVVGVVFDIFKGVSVAQTGVVEMQYVVCLF